MQSQGCTPKAIAGLCNHLRHHVPPQHLWKLICKHAACILLQGVCGYTFRQLSLGLLGMECCSCATLEILLYAHLSLCGETCGLMQH
jgi:hypothetical protein